MHAWKGLLLTWKILDTTLADKKEILAIFMEL